MSFNVEGSRHVGGHQAKHGIDGNSVFDESELLIRRKFGN